MAKVDFGEVADRLFRGFMAPLVIGGEMTPGKPIGGLVALAIGGERVAADPDLASHVQLARVRSARHLVPLDRLATATPSEWALASVLHDIVQSSHPSLRKKSAERLAAFADGTLDQIPPPPTIGDALSRHTWFARLFEIMRTDTLVSWWVGSRSFLGVDPPDRLTSWPELRRVQIAKTPRALLELPAHGGNLDASRLGGALSHFLTRTPLTDLATCARADPPFAWGVETLSLVSARAGLTLVLRALAHVPTRAVDAALGRATRALLSKAQWKVAAHALALLAERALAETSITTFAAKATAEAKGSDALFARAAGAVVARGRVAEDALGYSSDERRRVLQLLEGPATSASAREFHAMLENAGGQPAD